MDSPPKIKKVTKAGSYYGKTFWVEVWQPEGGRAFVHSVEIEGLPVFSDPEIDDSATIDEAIAAGFRFATQQIDY